MQARRLRYFLFELRLLPLNGTTPMSHKRPFTANDRNPAAHPLSREGDCLL